jgi:hypothetical protein
MRYEELKDWVEECVPRKNKKIRWLLKPKRLKGYWLLTIIMGDGRNRDHICLKIHSIMHRHQVQNMIEDALVRMAEINDKVEKDGEEGILHTVR